MSRKTSTSRHRTPPITTGSALLVSSGFQLTPDRGPPCGESTHATSSSTRLSFEKALTPSAIYFVGDMPHLLSLSLTILVATSVTLVLVQMSSFLSKSLERNSEHSPFHQPLSDLELSYEARLHRFTIPNTICHHKTHQSKTQIV